MTTSIRTRAVIWDWNGTLLNDLDCSLIAMNAVLAEFSLPLIPSLQAYRATFGFPIQNFYERVGFDVGPAGNFAAAAGSYLRRFAELVPQAPLQPGALRTLDTLASWGIQQVLISATVEEALQLQLQPHPIRARFDAIHGIIGDGRSASKTHVVAKWLESSGIDHDQVVMIGDTNHDREIAEELRLRFIGYAGGHQAPPAGAPHPVIDDLADLPALLEGPAATSTASSTRSTTDCGKA